MGMIFRQVTPTSVHHLNNFSNLLVFPGW